MKISDKLTTDISQLKNYVKTQRKMTKKIVICQGHFNVIHPGHMRFLEFASKQGDVLIVAVQGNDRILNSVRDRFFDESERARGVASLEYVAKVVIFNDINFSDILKLVRPDVYVRGEEFSKQIDRIKDEVDIVEKFGGKVIFSSGDACNVPTEFLEKNFDEIRNERFIRIRTAIIKQKINVKKLIKICKSFNRVRMLVIGDTIVDQYAVCDALGMSSEAPVLVIRELEHKEFVGGAAIVSRHVRSLGAECTFISLVGHDQPGSLVSEELMREGIAAKLFEDSERPTTFKIRYMVGTQKILRVSRLKDTHIDRKTEDSFIELLSSMANNVDGIIVSDFCYGVITPRILEHISSLAGLYRIKLFGDVQSSSQIGNVAKFNNFYLIKPTEKEARIALDDKYSGLEIIGNKLLRETGSQNLVLTLGSEGFISYKRTDNELFVKTQYFPALNPNPVDVVGAGDSLLTALAVSSCAGAELMEASVIGAVIAAISVGKIGNIPIKCDEVIQYLETI